MKLSGQHVLQGFDKVVPPFEALLKFHGGEGFEEVVPFSKTHRNSACTWEPWSSFLNLVSDVVVSLGVTSPFFPGILPSRKPQKAPGKWLVFEKNDC